ncbi:MAG: hypothetical protein KC609_07990 [Myxococcales bacterium]|nr:hypothetical protein [Myxococcales bacterium]
MLSVGRLLYLFAGFALFAVGCVPSPGRIGTVDALADSAAASDTAVDAQLDSFTPDIALDGDDALADGASPDGVEAPDGDLASPDLADGIVDPDLVVDPDLLADADGTTDAVVVTVDLPEGVLGLPPSDCATIRTLLVTNDRSFERNREIAFSGIPLPASLGLLDTKRLIVTNESGAWVRAQFDVLSRWGGTLEGTNAATRPIRWLQIALVVTAGDKSTRSFELRQCTSDPQLPTSDALEARIVDESDGTKTVETGVARFRLNPYNPALIEWIDVDFQLTGSFDRVYTHRVGSGPLLVGPKGTLVTTLGAYTSLDHKQTVVVAPRVDNLSQPDVRIIERGPLKVSVLVRGVFRHSALERDCTNNGVSDPTDPFGYSAVLTFFRGSADVGLQLNFRNECGSLSNSGYTEDFTDEGADIDRVSWEFPLDIGGTKLFGASSTQLFSSDNGFAGTLRVGQDKGSIGVAGGWKPAGTIQLEPDSGPSQSLLETGLLIEPYVALNGPSYSAFAQLAYLPYREPMALVVGLDNISLQIVSQPLHVGEAKAIWSAARIAIRPLVPQGLLRDANQRLHAFLQRGLLPRLPLAELNEAKVFPYLGNEKSSVLKATYTAAINKVHGLTVGYPVDPNPSEPGQWKRAFTFGSQLWPDTQLFPTSELTITSPLDNVAYTNDSDPVTPELLEYFRSGDPKFVWDFALPQANLMMFTAWYNTGMNHTWLNGFATNRGGTQSEGDWHRKADLFTLGFSFNGGIANAYVIRPNPLFLDRFAQQYYASLFTYDKPRVQQGDRSWYQLVELLADFTSDQSYDPASGFALLQHLEALANCAEFLRADLAESCRTAIVDFVDELIADNVVSGVLCNGDLPPTTECRNSSLYLYLQGFAAFIWRLRTLSPEQAMTLGETVVQLSELLLAHGVPRLAGQIDVTADWTRYFRCAKSGSLLAGCEGLTADGWDIFQDRKPQALVLPLIAMQLGTLSIDYCPLLKAAFDKSELYSLWSTLYTTDSNGWVEGNSEVMQSMIFGVGGLDLCAP